MKKTRILTVTAIGLTAALMVGMCGCGIMDLTNVKFDLAESGKEVVEELVETVNGDGSGDGMTSAEVEEIDSKAGYMVGNGAATSQVDNLLIDWVSGKVTIQYGDVDYIQFEEISKTDLDGREHLRYQEKDGTLSIWFVTPSISFSGEIQKDLVVTIPKSQSFENLTVDCVSADLYLPENLQAKDVIVDTVSGEVTMEGLGYVTNFTVDSVSGKMDLKIAATESITFDTTSGDIDLGLPADTEFTATLDAVSGDFTSDFQIAVKDDVYTSGAGTVKIDMNSVSGDLYIYPIK